MNFLIFFLVTSLALCLTLIVCLLLHQRELIRTLDADSSGVLERPFCDFGRSAIGSKPVTSKVAGTAAALVLGLVVVPIVLKGMSKRTARAVRKGKPRHGRRAVSELNRIGHRK